MDHTHFRVKADVDLDAIAKNIKAIQKGLKDGVRTCAVIKADAYGHGAVPVAKRVEPLVDFFAVATIEEALELRRNLIFTPILILGYVHHSRSMEAVANDVRLTVFDYDTAKKISDSAAALQKKAYIHIKIDTGMSRIGFPPDAETLEVIKRIRALPNIEIEGIFTHLFGADERSKASAMKQIMTFTEFCNDLEKAGIKIPVKHCSNSAAAINLSLANCDMVRLGIAMYGLYPSRYVRQIPLKPALSLKSHIVMLKEIKAGTSVSYGATWTAPKDTMVATIPVGYADGYMRLLSGRGYVLIRGKKAPILGRVCMDQLMVDVSRIPKAKLFDEVVLIGKQKDGEITAEELADLAETINYEIVCSISPRVPRIYHSRGDKKE